MKTIKYFLSTLTILLVTLSSCQTYEFDEPGLLVPLTVTEDSSLPSIMVNGTQLHSEAYGDPKDPIIVTIHGGPGGDYKSIENFIQLADNGYYVVFYDQRGSGLSQRHDKAFYDDQNVQMFIDDLDGVIQYYKQNDTQRVILAGHSWGAMLATAYINQYPDEIDGAILAEPGGFTWNQTIEYINRSLNLNPVSESTNDALFFEQIITGDDHQTLDYKLGLFAGQSQTGDVGPAVARRWGGVLSTWAQKYAEDHPEEMDFRANLNQFESEVLFVYSENNEAYGLAHAEEVASPFSSTQLHEIRNCGHEIIQYGWESLYPIAVNYLDSLK